MAKFHINVLIPFAFVAFSIQLKAQNNATKATWIRPDNERSAPVWGIHNGIVVGLWPAAIEGRKDNEGGPRGLLRIGYEHDGITYLINFIAVEPVVDGDMEFSEVSPSRVDDKWGKFIWAADSLGNDRFSGKANTRGTITHPDKQHPEIEELSFYVFVEQYLDGAHPYFKLSIHSDKPGELGIQIFNQKNSAKMERCALTATMGNYSRLRLLYLKDKIVDSRVLFSGYDDIDFIEKDIYNINQMLRDENGPIVLAEPSETLAELNTWPNQPAYRDKIGWRYRPNFKLTQYWRMDAKDVDTSLKVRVNGRVKYWGVENPDKSKYINVPGGPAFENFELRENYYAGQTFYFGLSLKPAKEIISSFKN